MTSPVTLTWQSSFTIICPMNPKRLYVGNAKESNFFSNKTGNVWLKRGLVLTPHRAGGVPQIPSPLSIERIPLKKKKKDSIVTVTECYPNILGDGMEMFLYFVAVPGSVFRWKTKFLWRLLCGQEAEKFLTAKLSNVLQERGSPWRFQHQLFWGILNQ